MICWTFPQTSSGSVSGSGMIGMNIKPPVLIFMELKAMEETGKKKGIPGLGGEWYIGPPLGDLPRKTAKTYLSIPRRQHWV